MDERNPNSVTGTWEQRKEQGAHNFGNTGMNKGIKDGSTFLIVTRESERTEGIKKCRTRRK